LKRLGEKRRISTGCRSLDDILGGGVETQSEAVYIDTEGTFRPERIVQMAEYRGIEPRTALRNIIYARVYDVSEQLAILPLLEKLAQSDEYKLIIVDNISTTFRLEAAKTIREKGKIFRELAFFAFTMAELALKYNLAVVVTNQLISRPGRGESPVGGIFLESFVTTCLKFSRAGGDYRRIEVMFSRNPEIKAGFCRVHLSEIGLISSP